MNHKPFLPLAFWIFLTAVHSALAQPVVLISTNAVWRYLDDGSDQASAWRDPGFNDSSWASGAAPLGYGLSSITTTQATGRVTYYHRLAFKVTEPRAFSNLVLRLRRDDGAVVYLNDLELFRSNMDEGPVDFRTLASISTTGPNQLRYYTNNLLPERLVAGTNVMAVEIHQAGTNSIDAAFGLELVGEPDTTPPTIALASPTSGATYVVGDSIAISAFASDESDIARVEFYVDNQPLATVSSVPYAATLGNVRYGTHTLTAIAQDQAGLRATSAPVNLRVTLDPGCVTLVQNQTCWSYWDRGAEPDSEWSSLGYDDTSWPVGYAELGYGDGDEATEVSYGGDPNHKHITTYFRHWFSVADPTLYTHLILRLKSDDGAVVYLNGAEIFRDNLPTGLIGPLTPAQSPSSDDMTYLTASVPSQTLRAGENLLAVEIHQHSELSPDMSFDLRLLGKAGVLRPTLSIAASGPATVVLSWPETIGSHFILQRTSGISEIPSWENIALVGKEPPRFAFAVGPSSSYFRLATTNAEDSFCQPPLIIAQSFSQRLDVGSSVTLSTVVAGSAPLTYQWFHNAVKVDGAITPTLFMPNVDRIDGGDYELCVSGACGFNFTKPIMLIVGGGNDVPTPDQFAERRVLLGPSGRLNVDTSTASAEIGEPRHAHQVPSHSVWFSMTAPVTGIVDMRTDGSSFDTVLSVYRGTNLATLESIAENDDGGLRYRSRVRFPAVEGDVFALAVDGYEGRSGVVQLDWSLLAGDTSIPIITQHPDNLHVEEGGEATFSAEVTGFASLQWFHGDQLIAGATTPAYTIPKVSPSDAGSYRLVALNGANSVSSLSAVLVVAFGTGQTIGVDGASKPQKCDGDFPLVSVYENPSSQFPPCWVDLEWPFLVGVYDNSISKVLVPAKVRARYCPKPYWFCVLNCDPFRKAGVVGLTSADSLSGKGNYRFEAFRINPPSSAYTIFVDFKK
ncbi:MAG: hypothetical protein HY299_12410 [Verrucomicrobia bacterium]|nr:hypothetical protein [Verrucomicrobiota bacterium]